ncbi:MAG TPA: hypothetical protein PLA65_00575 [Spirochaetota bacterium]|nr:hypothetical protein [Spirochaetota bacterium]
MFHTITSGTRQVKRKRFFLPVLLFLCLPFLSPRPDASGTVMFPFLPQTTLHNARVIAGPGGASAFTVRDLTYQTDSDPFITDIVLSFNTPPARLTRDDTRHYRVIARDYNFVTGRGSLGAGCAQFFKKEHGVSIETVKNAWLGTCDDLGSFTIEFRFLPYEVRDGSVLFSRVGYFSGIKRGIDIVIRDGRIVAGLYGIFDKPLFRTYDVMLRRGRAIAKMEWYHVSLSFDRISGKLTKNINGEEDEATYMTESGEAFNGVYSPSFGYRAADGSLVCVDAPPATIGKGFSGLMDEFRISYRHFDDLEKAAELAYRNYRSTKSIGRIPFNVEGVVTSPVYRFAETGTRVQEFRWREDSRPETYVWMEFRISDSRFEQHDTRVKWYRVGNNQKKIFMTKQANGEYLRGKYYQWRAHLVPSPDGKRAPSLWGIELDYRLDLAPNAPRFLEATAGNGRIVLKWRKNVDHDILGYNIYYGTHPGRYDGIISRVNGGRITNGSGTGNSVQVTITGEVIEENRALDKREKLSFPLIENNVLYYFSVSGYDTYRPGTSYNHESELSSPVTARPNSGPEID